MNRKEIAEIKKQLTMDRCAITRICGCFVDNEKEQKAHMKEAFLSLPEEEIFKYLEIFRKTLSGTVGKGLLNLEFPLAAENPGSMHDLLQRLRESALEDDILLDTFYDKIIESCDYAGSFLILLIHGAYDIPGKALDGTELFDASDETYRFLLCSVCPVNLSKEGLSCDTTTGEIRSRIRDWLVEMPDAGFLFPAFHDRSSDIHSMLFYSRNTSLFPEGLMSAFGAALPAPAPAQREAFQVMVEEALGEECTYEAVKNLHEQICGQLEAAKDEAEPLSYSPRQMRRLLEENGASEESLSVLDRQLSEDKNQAPVLAGNLINPRKMEIRTPDITIQVSSGQADLIETRFIDGRECLVIPLEGEVRVGGIQIRPRRQ